MLKHIALFEGVSGKRTDNLVDRLEQTAPIRHRLPDRSEFRRNYVRPDGDVAAAHIADQAPKATFGLIVTMLSPEGEAPGWSDAGLSEHFRLAKTFVAEERRSLAATLGAGGPLPTGPGAVKMICLIKRRPGMSHGAFIDYYEQGHAPLAVKHLPMIAGYHRSYVRPAGSGTTDPGVSPAIDVMTEMWFRSETDFQALQTALADPVLGEMFAEDEKKLFDRKNIQMFLVDERVG